MNVFVAVLPSLFVIVIVLVVAPVTSTPVTFIAVGKLAGSKYGALSVPNVSKLSASWLIVNIHPQLHFAHCDPFHLYTEYAFGCFT